MIPRHVARGRHVAGRGRCRPPPSFERNTTMAKQSKIYPVPAAIDGRKWTAAEVHQGGACDTRQAKIWTPTGLTPDDFFVRLHETMHARVTPQVRADSAARKAKVTLSALQHAEDYRVNRELDLRDLIPDGDWIGAPMRALIGQRMRTDREIALAELSTGIGCYGGPPIIYEHRTTAEVDEIRDTLLVIVRECRERVKRTPRGRHHGRFDKIMSSKAGFQKFSLPLAAMIDEYYPENPPPAGGAPGGKMPPPSRSATDCRWTEPKIETAPLSVCRRVVPAPAPRPSDCGTVPRYLHRYCDGSGTIWARRAKLPGGTVLIDGSGSMCWDDESLERVIRRAPGCRIAVYSDDRLLIVGEGGRLADADWVIGRLPGGNGSDGRALDWLLSQEAPRTWVTDYGVTDAKGNHTQRAIDACRERVARGGVRVVLSADRV